MFSIEDLDLRFKDKRENVEKLVCFRTKILWIQLVFGDFRALTEACTAFLFHNCNANCFFFIDHENKM